MNRILSFQMKEQNQPVFLTFKMKFYAHHDFIFQNLDGINGLDQCSVITCL